MGRGDYTIIDGKAELYLQDGNARGMVSPRRFAVCMLAMETGRPPFFRYFVQRGIFRGRKPRQKKALPTELSVFADDRSLDDSGPRKYAWHWLMFLVLQYGL